MKTEPATMHVLYHFTSPAGAADILTSGFQGELCWLSPDPMTVCGEQERHVLLEVVLRASETEMEPFKRVVEEETIDEDGEVVPEEFEPVSYYWYEFPPRVLNELLFSCREVSVDERRALLE